MAEDELGENGLEEGDEDEGGASSKQRITAIATEEALDEVLKNAEFLEKKVIIVAWLLPGDKGCDELMMPFLKKMREDNIMILVANPATLPDRAQKIGLFAVPTFQFYRKELVHTLVGTNQDKFTGYFKKLYRDLQEQIKLEKYIERSAPTDSTLASGEKAEPETSTFTIGVGWAPSVAEADPSVDIEVLALMLNDGGKAPSAQHVVHSSHPAVESTSPPCLALLRNAPDRKNLEEDDVLLEVSLDAVEPGVLSIVFVVAIMKAEEKEQNLEQVVDLYIRGFDRSQKKAMFTYSVATAGVADTAAVVARLERAEEGSSTWEFVATMEGVEGGYDGVFTKFTEAKAKKKKK